MTSSKSQVFVSNEHVRSRSDEDIAWGGSPDPALMTGPDQQMGTGSNGNGNSWVQRHTGITETGGYKTSDLIFVGCLFEGIKSVVRIRDKLRFRVKHRASVENFRCTHSTLFLQASVPPEVDPS